MFDIEAVKRPAEPEERAIPSGCPNCHGRPWVTVYRLGIECSVRCSCEKGRYLKAKDAERREAGR